MTSGGLAAVSSSAFAALYSAFGKYDVVHIHAEGPAFFAWLPKMFGKRVVVALFSILLFLMIDYVVRGSESFIQVSIISKLFSSKNKVSLDASGMARADLIFLALQSMVRHPFGVGYSNLGALMDVENTGMAGAAIMQFGAAWGFLPLIVVAWWIFYPVLKFCRKRYVAVLYIVMYINTVLAQSDLFYPVLIMIPVGLYSLHYFDATYFASGTVYHVLKNEKYKGTYVGAKFIMPVPCKHRVLRAPLEQQVRIEDSHAAIVTPEEFEQAQMVIMLQHGKHQAGNYTKHQYPLKGKVYCGYCQKLMKYRVLKKLGPSFNCRFSATAVDSPCKRIPISEELLEHIVRNALTAQIKQAEYVLEILHERERKALICFSALERQEEKLSTEKAEIVKQRVALYEQYADGNMSKEEFIRQRDAYRAQEDERMEQIQRLRTEKDQAFQPVKKDTDNLQAVMNTVGEAGDVMHLSQNVVETFIDRIEVFNDESVKIRFTFEDAVKSYETE